MHAVGHGLDGARYVGFVPVRDLDAARAFYVDQLGLSVLEESPFALVVDAHGTKLRLTPVPEHRAEPYTIAGWDVPDLERCVDDLEAAGVEFRQFEGMDQDPRGIWSAPGGDRVAWFADPDGNTLSVTAARP